MAYLVIDGQLDYRYMKMYNTGFHLRDHFVSSDKSTKYFFKFNNSVWSDKCNIEYINNSTKYEDIGAISIYFYRARPVKMKFVRECQTLKLNNLEGCGNHHRFRCNS